MECGFLVERQLQGVPRPTFLIEADTRKPATFAASKDALEEAETVLTHLTLRYNWNTRRAQAHWAGKDLSPCLSLASGGIEIGMLNSLKPKMWVELPNDSTDQLAKRLEVSSLVTVSDAAGGSAQILVMEDGMTHKASLLQSLSAADILRYWSMLTPEQRSAFLEDRLGMLLFNAAPDDFQLKAVCLPKTDDSLFDRFAGFFHAFHTMETSVCEALAAGKKHDSLGHLLDRLESADDAINDDVDRYVITMCARQSLDFLRAQERDFWEENKGDARDLRERVTLIGDKLRAVLSPVLGTEFIGWFEKHFLSRASVQPLPEDSDEDS
jgi:hypothetical protein